MTGPVVTVGMPVHNAEDHLVEAVESILGQTHRDLRLVIADNASTDATADLARGFSEQDDRVLYYRHPTNIGANANYNGLVAFSAGSPYFKWAAHDDVLEPDYLAQCLDMLERRPEVVGCHSRTRLVDRRGEPLVRTARAWLSRDGVFARTDPDGYVNGLRSADPAVRFQAAVVHKALNGHVFAVLRTSALLATGLQLPFYGADRVLVAELALHGPLETVEAELWRRRAHRSSSMAIVTWADRNRWAAPGAPPAVYPLVMARAYAGAIRRAPLDRRDRRRCAAVLAAKVVGRRSLRRLLPGRHSYWRQSSWPGGGLRRRSTSSP